MELKRKTPQPNYDNSVEVFFVSFNSDMGLWLMFVVISGGGQTM